MAAAFATTAGEAGERMLAPRIVSAPQLSALDAALERLDGWFPGLDGHPARTTLRRGRHFPAFGRALPHLVPLLICWSVGEMIGYLAPPE